eukprot:COSAG02_NODE_861_length_16429_cov_75.930680_7_plen_91_part_00
MARETCVSTIIAARNACTQCVRAARAPPPRRHPRRGAIRARRSRARRAIPVDYPKYARLRDTSSRAHEVPRTPILSLTQIMIQMDGVKIA